MAETNLIYNGPDGSVVGPSSPGVHPQFVRLARWMDRKLGGAVPDDGTACLRRHHQEGSYFDPHLREVSLHGGADCGEHNSSRLAWANIRSQNRAGYLALSCELSRSEAEHSGPLGELLVSFVASKNVTRPTGTLGRQNNYTCEEWQFSPVNGRQLEAALAIWRLIATADMDNIEDLQRQYSPEALFTQFDNL